MFLLLNGAFGIGKTTSARALVARAVGASIYDPEPAGVAIQRLLALVGRPVDDFQDVALWSHLTVLGSRLTHRRAALVVVPMAFSNLGRLAAIRAALGPVAPVVNACLVAPLETVIGRWEARARAERRPVDAWELRRAAESCAAHASFDYGRHVAATQPTAAIVDELVALVRG